ncbi:helix-turn-helix domain-containing protein [Pelobacter propionicus]|nr:helix-turn-helix domain-containing protein [Pelobacter propionicus]
MAKDTSKTGKNHEAAAANITAAAGPDRWLTIKEAAEISALKENTLYCLCLKRALPSYKIAGKMRRIKETDLIKWMESCRVEAR